MQTSNAGIALIKHFEGLEVKAYRDSVGVLTIGYGHTHGVKAGDEITGQQADAFLREDLLVAEMVVSNSVKSRLNQNQFDALVSFVFNLGAGNFVKSTLLKKLNAGDYAGAAGQFERWIYAGKRELPGLVRRRAAEKRMFLT